MCLTDLPRSVLAQCLGRLSARDMANCDVALVGHDAASSLLEDASFEALTRFAAEHAFDPTRIARHERETWKILWAQTASIFEALEAFRDADGTSFPDAGPLTAMLLFGSPYDVHAPRKPGTARVEKAIRIAVDAYVAILRAASRARARSPHGCPLARLRSRVVGVSRALARSGAWTHAARIDQNLLRAILTRREELNEPPEGVPTLPDPTVYELDISASEYLVDALYSNTYVRVAESDANAISYATRCAHRAVTALHRHVAARAPEGWFDDPNGTNDAPPHRETKLLADAMTAFARAMGLAAQHAWLDALDASRVDAYDARVWPTYPDSGPEDLFERASLAARSARRVYSHIGEKARAARALAALAEISFCEASVLPRRMFTRLGQSSGASGVMEDLPRLGVAGHGSAIERFRRALREFDELERLAANDEDADARGSAESRARATWAATAKKDLGKTLYALIRYARWWDTFETALPPGALPEGERLATWDIPERRTSGSTRPTARSDASSARDIRTRETRVAWIWGSRATTRERTRTRR